MSHRKYKLTYFNSRGRAELSRLLFAAAAVDYEDIRVDFDQWPQIKPTITYGILPILEFDGETLCQSMAIARFLARQFGFAGKTLEDQLRADMIVACIDDIVEPLIIYRFEKDAAKKADQKEQLTDMVTTQLANLENMLISNNGGDGYFVGRELTWADLHFFNRGKFPETVELDVNWALYPKLITLIERVGKLPRIKSWVENRPATAN